MTLYPDDTPTIGQQIAAELDVLDAVHRDLTGPSLATAGPSGLDRTVRTIKRRRALGHLDLTARELDGVPITAHILRGIRGGRR